MVIYIDNRHVHGLEEVLKMHRAIITASEKCDAGRVGAIDATLKSIECEKKQTPYLIWEKRCRESVLESL